MTQENGGASLFQSNGYDRYGNRWVELNGGLQSLYFNASNNRITTAGYVYDPAGNLLSDGVHAYAFDAENRIKSVDGLANCYQYDGEGRRVKKLLPSGEQTRFVYDIDGNLIAEFNGATGALLREYIYGVDGLLASVEPGAGVKYTTADSLGSPRAMTSGTGGTLSRHDYMPFGEEMFAGTGGRTTAQGFNAADGIRKKFTGKERDDENGQDYFLARSLSPWQGRFTSIDPGPFTPADPQSWNRYAYVQNNPLKFVDPTGKTLVIIGDYADELLAELSAKTGFGLLIDKKTGIVTIDSSVKRKRDGTSTRMANLLRTIIKDSGTLKLRTMILPDQTPHAFVDSGRDDKEFYMDDYRVANSKDKKLGSILLAHVLREGYAHVVLNQHLQYPGGNPHELALVFEIEVLSELTGQKEQKRVQTQLNLGSRIEYTSVAYDIYHKQDGGPPDSKTIILVNNKNCGCKR